MNRHINPGYFVPFNVMPYSTEKCHHWAIVTSLNPCTPTPLRADDVIFLFLVYGPTPFALMTSFFSIYRLRPSTLRPDDVIIFDDVTMTSPT